MGESKNLAAENPEIVRELNNLISGFLRDTEAVIPVRNPAYNADAARQAALIASTGETDCVGMKQ